MRKECTCRPTRTARRVLTCAGHWASKYVLEGGFAIRRGASVVAHASAPKRTPNAPDEPDELDLFGSGVFTSLPVKHAVGAARSQRPQPQPQPERKAAKAESAEAADLESFGGLRDVLQEMVGLSNKDLLMHDIVRL